MSQSNDPESESIEWTSVPVTPSTRDELYRRKLGPTDTYDAVLQRLLETDE